MLSALLAEREKKGKPIKVGIIGTERIEMLLSLKTDGSGASSEHYDYIYYAEGAPRIPVRPDSW